MTALSQETRVPIKDRGDELKAMTTSLVDRLAKQINGGYSDHFREFLAFYGKLYSYSPNNVMLMMLQRPDGSAFASYNAWKRLGRQVRKGSSAVAIWAPVFARQEDKQTGETRQMLVGFRPTGVFAAEDLEDIDVNPLPALHRPQPDDVTETFDYLAARAELAGIKVDVMPLNRRMGGFAQGGFRVAINSLIDSRNQVCVLLHEVAHIYLHQRERKDGEPRIRDQQAEAEAESIAFVLSNAIGIEDTLASDYLGHWKVTPKQLNESLERINYGVRKLRDVLDIDGLRTPIDTASVGGT